MYILRKLIILVIVTFFINSCATGEDPIIKETRSWSVEKLYSTAAAALADKNYSRAIKLYKVLESTFPYGTFARRGLLDLAYSYYQSDDLDNALLTLEQFIATYPTNINMDYALYLKGYINYKNDNGLLSRFTRQDLSERDPKGVIEAYNSFNKLVTSYPNSRFIVDAQDKINKIVNALALGEIYRATYYMDIDAYIGAVNRAQNVIKKYSNSIYLEEALAIEIRAYHELNQTSAKNNAYNVLKLNFPKSKYVQTMWDNKNNISWYKFWR